MATTKKKPATKTTATKPAAKKTTVKATAARKSAPKKSSAKRPVISAASFRPMKEQTPFLSFSFTVQSAYWLILSLLVLALGAWVMYLNVKIQGIYDQVEINTQLNDSYVAPAAKSE
jgi:hypothetical protein